jgi:NAD(P)-dependent dehydrogenase (short-subunit alcohol dehydrogenase family)
MSNEIVPSQAGKIAIITGGNRGLGLEIAKVLVAAQAHVVLACRDANKAKAAVAQLQQLTPSANVEAMELDVADLASVRRFADAFKAKFSKLDLLVHNAAAIMVPKSKTRDGFEMHLGTNHLGPFALTGLLLDRLNAADEARVINMASLAHNLTKGLDPDDAALDKREYTEMDAYGRSKLAALLFTFELNRRLKKSGSRVLALAAHPGYSATNLDLGGFWMRLATRLFAQPAAHGAWPALHAATAAGVQGDDYYGPGGFKELGGKPEKVGRRAEARDPVLAKRLWELSEKLTGQHYLND